ncbi:hypothetical protein N657DRAFT_639469 [Parathielavia appendiculata]|uniref:Sphingolipid long chain base-responsive protein LSP1 n=1 Tax=Parathielavia appendiculata TaxID=2587402 RepID=A0AAN6U9H9_9PEZI|nr:hypothetical protein N657DRAFT_639469 [Parathielavia appendiculata]
MNTTNRALSLRSSNRSSNGTTASTNTTSSTNSHHRYRFSLTSLRDRMPHSSSTTHQPTLAKRLHRLIKSTNTLIAAHSTAARERLSIATQLSEWGETTHPPAPSLGGGGTSTSTNDGDDGAISDISDKLGVLLSELGEQEEAYAQRLEESRAVLKVIRNTERSVQPSREGKARIAGEIVKVKGREPQSTRLVTLEQELVRAEAEGLVAEAQLGNVTRQKLKEAYTAEFLATIERAEKQAILARHGLRLLQLLDDTPVVPGDVRPPYAHASQARQILNDAEDDLREWRLDGVFVGDDKTVAVKGTVPVAPKIEEKGKQKEKVKQQEVDKGSIAETDGGVNARI